jgi:hypothetical protein
MAAPESLLCPVCDETGPPLVSLKEILLCGSCGASLVINQLGMAVQASAQHTTALDVGELQQLRKARGRIARPERKQH